MDCNLPGPSVHGILQARILKCVAISISRGSSQGSNPHLLHWWSHLGSPFSLLLYFFLVFYLMLHLFSHSCRNNFWCTGWGSCFYFKPPILKYCWTGWWFSHWKVCCDAESQPAALGHSLRSLVSNKFPADADADGLRSTFWREETGCKLDCSLLKYSSEVLKNIFNYKSCLFITFKFGKDWEAAGF